MELVKYVSDNPDLDDVSILVYAALRAAVTSCAPIVAVQHLAKAFEASVGHGKLVCGDLTDAKVLAQAAIDAHARTQTWDTALLDALLDTLRELEQAQPGVDDITSAA